MVGKTKETSTVWKFARIQTETNPELGKETTLLGLRIGKHRLSAMAGDALIEHCTTTTHQLSWHIGNLVPPKSATVPSPKTDTRQYT